MVGERRRHRGVSRREPGQSTSSPKDGRNAVQCPRARRVVMSGRWAAAKNASGQIDMRDAPRLGAYLAQLPAGLDSHPECTAKASVVRKVYEFARDNPLVGLPEPLQRLLDEPLPSSTWVPQAQVLAAIVAMVEASRRA